MVPIDFFDTAVELYRKRIAIVDDDVTVSFGELAQMSRALAASFLDASEPPQRSPIAIFSPNDYRVLVVMIAAYRFGSAVVPLHAGNSVEANLHVISKVRPRWLFYHSSLASQVAVLRTKASWVDHWICIDAAGALHADSTPRPLLGLVEEWIDTSGNPTSPVYYWSTSGSSGPPKIVIDTCESFVTSLLLMRLWHHGLARTPVALALAPMSHSGGPYCFTMLTLGATVIVSRKFDPDNLAQLIGTHRVTHLWMPPTALYLTLDSPHTRSHDLSTVKSLQLGMAAASATKLREALGVFGPTISHTYGQIETGFLTVLEPATLANAMASGRPERAMSAGQSVFVNRVAVMDEDGRLVPQGETGEIVARGRCVKRYLDDAETAEARRFGWHHTGDTGYFDDDGFLFIVGRTKDVVNMAGFKIQAAEVERAIMELAEVQECAVVAAPHSIRGEVVKAVVTVRPGHAIDAAAVIAHCRARLGARAAPVAVETWDQLPRSPAGKIDKRSIRERFWNRP